MHPQSNTIELPLLHGKVALIDGADYSIIAPYKWSAWFSGRRWYAMAHALKPNKGMIYMHRLIMDAPKDKKVDHWDGDGMNNQRDNLRFATNQQNLFNRGPIKNSTSGYKGVTWDKKSKLWQAQIILSKKGYRKNYFLGKFIDPADAARTYDAKALELFGEFAWFNFPDKF